jgi:hypothetical protein
MSNYNHSLTKFFWLLSPFIPRPQKLCEENELEEACSFVDEYCWRLLPYVMPKFLDWVGKENRNSNCVKQLQAYATALTKFSQVQNTALLQIARLLNEKKVPYVFLKSSSLRWTIYDNPSDRFGADLDIAVPTDWLKVCESAIKELGFEPVQWNRGKKKFERANPILRRAIESRHYELCFFVHRQELEIISLEDENIVRSQMNKRPMMFYSSSDDKLYCNIILDIHHGLTHERNISVEPIINCHRIIEIDKTALNIPTSSWLLLHLICKVYFEKEDEQNAIYQYADICRLINSISNEEHKHFCSLLREYDLEIASEYVLNRLKSILKTSSTDFKQIC